MATDVANQDQRKRALEALERRFSAAESETLHSEKRNKKRRGEDVNVSTISHLSSPSTTTPKKLNAPAPPCTDVPLKKDARADDPYMKILQPVHEKLLTTVEASDGGKEIIRKIQHHLLSSGDIAQKYMQGYNRKNGHGYIRLDNCVQKQSTRDDRLRALRSLSKRSKKHMSMKELKMHGSHNLPPESQKYEIFVPMHEMWKDYVIQMLKNVGKQKVADCLLGADLHGAILRVIEHKTGAFNGAVGIMIRETAEAFGIITQENKFIVVPKRNSVFALQASCWKITLHGETRVSGRPSEGTKK